jgi:hyaluronan synthase
MLARRADHHPTATGRVTVVPAEDARSSGARGVIVPEADERARSRRLWTAIGHRLLRGTILFYAGAILVFAWSTKQLAFASLMHDPLFAGYSIAVVIYLMSRFVLALFYRPTPDRGYRPSVSIIVPAFNEERCIGRTLEACLGVEYPPHLLQVIAVDDGSTDGTWRQIEDVRRRHGELYAIDLGKNYGKRTAMAEGVRRATGEIVCFIDSDSYVAPDAIVHIVQPFTDERVGASVGHAEVANRMVNWLTKMQQVRYYAAFQVIKGTESLLSGTVTCASGCCAAYRRSVILPELPGWESQMFLGVPATFGDDRALTNRVLRARRVVFQASARSETVVPESLLVFFRQQLRWKKSWLRESTYVARYFWRKNPLAVLFTYASILFPLLSPVVVVHAVYMRLATGTSDGLWFYLIGTYSMALLYSLYYAYRREAAMWHHGLTFVAIYMGVLVFQTYWGILTMRDNRWGTRSSTVTHEPIDPSLLTILLPDPVTRRFVEARSTR